MAGNSTGLYGTTSSNITILPNNNTGLYNTGISPLPINGNITANNISATGNVNVGGYVSAVGNVTGNYILGNGYYLTDVQVNYSNANVANYLPTYSGDISSAGVGLSGIFSDNYNYANGTPVSFDGTYSNANVASYLPTYSGNVANLTVTGNVLTVGNVTGTYINGNGAFLTGLPDAYSNANVANYLPVYSGNISANSISASGNITADILRTPGGLGNIVGVNYTVSNFFVGDGSLLTNLPATNYGNANVAAYLPVYGGNILANTITSTDGISASGNITSGYGIYGVTISSSGNVVAPILINTDNRVKLGQNAGVGNIANTVAIGRNAGFSGQADSSIAIGPFAGNASQAGNSIAIGRGAGQTSQGANAIAIGRVAGNTTQGGEAIAIGRNAGQNSQGNNAIALGFNAGVTNQPANSIMINASSNTLNGTNAGFYVNPVRNDLTNTANVVYFDYTTNELTYAPATGGGSYGNANVAAYLPTDSTIIGIQSSISNTNSNVSNLANIVASNSNDIITLQSEVYANANVAAYLPTYTGNILAGNISATGQIAAADGSAGAPSIVFAGDIAKDTGFYWVSDGNIGVSINATQQALFNTNGVSVSGNISASGKIYGLELTSTQASGDEGGQINLANAVTNTTLAGSVVIDVYQNKLRFWEDGGNNRGAYIDISQAAVGVGTNLLDTNGTTPGGSNTYVQFNDADAFGGNAQFTYDKVTDSLRVGNVISDSNGAGTNFQVGDDVWIGDINQSDTLGIKGIQSNGTQAYIVFGNSNGAKFGRNGTGPLTYEEAFSATGNISTANYFVGNGSALTSINGSNVTGTVANATYATTAGTVTTNAQPNITSVGTLSSVTSTGLISTTGNMSAGNIIGTYLWGDGSNITGITNAAHSIQIDVKNTSGGTLTAGTPVYATGSVGATTVLEVSASRADTTATMPCIGLLETDLVNNAFGYAMSVGSLTGIDTSTYTINATLYVGATGGLTTTRPNNGYLVQPIGTVGRVNASTGTISVNIWNYFQLPNLGNGNIWVGNASSIPTEQAAYTNANVAAYLPTYTGALTASTITATGNISGSYILGNGALLTGITASYGNTQVAAFLPTYTGNLTAGNLSASGNVILRGYTAAGINGQVRLGNIDSFNNQYSNVFVDSYLSVYGDVTVGNLPTSGLANIKASGFVSAAGNVIGNFFIGNGSQLTGIVTTYGNANVADYLPTYTGNLAGGNAIIANYVSATRGYFTNNTYTGAFTAHGASFDYLTDTARISVGIGDSIAFYNGGPGNVLLANINSSGVLTASVLNATGNLFAGGGASITGSVSAAGNITGGNIRTVGQVTATGNISGSYILGNGALLTGITASYGNTEVAAFLPTYSGNIGNTGNSVATTFVNYKDAVYPLTYGATITPDPANGSIQTVTLTGNVTLSAFGGTPQAGQHIILRLNQDATGNRVLTSTMKWSGGFKTLSTAANSIDIATIWYDGTNYWASLTRGYA